MSLYDPSLIFLFVFRFDPTKKDSFVSTEGLLLALVKEDGLGPLESLPKEEPLASESR